MRWDQLFADLEAQSEALDARERSTQVDELARMEISRIGLVDRLLPAVGTLIGLRGLGDVRLTGTLRRVGPEWLLLDEGPGREAVVALAAVLHVAGIGRLSASPGRGGPVESRLGLGHALRAVARDRSPVRLHLIEGGVEDGTIDRVGMDFLELARHGAGEPRRHSEVRDVQIVAFRAVSVVRRQV